MILSSLLNCHMTEMILIIEDEQGIADTISYALKTEGLATLHSPTGKNGLQEIENNPIDLVILDIGLPDINGFDLLKKIRSTSDIPVLILTARSEEIDRILGLELGGDDYVVKPFSPRELTARVRAILRRSKNENTSPTLSPHPFKIDRNRRQITYFNSPLSLSRYEFEMLCLFIERPGWVFSREKIMDLIWLEPEESFERTVDAHIKSIRAKLKEVNPDLDPIMTHRGVGYSLREDT